jgi:hypothetical protein
VKALEGKLSRLVRSIVKKARDDSDFAQEICEILAPEGRGASSVEPSTPAKRQQFNPVTFLHEHGQDRLCTELGYMTDSELREIIRAQGIRRGKEVQTIERGDMINEIVAHSDRRLHQGASFLSKS